jgi:hypothetical protein
MKRLWVAVLGAVLARGQALGPAVSATEEAMGALHALILEMQLERQREIRADRVRDKLAVARREYIQAIRELDTEVRRLESNPEANAKALSNLRKLRADSAQVHDRLKTLTSLADLTSNMTTAQRRGALKQTMDEVQVFLSRLQGEMKENRAALTRSGVDAVGTVMIVGVEALHGKMEILMEDYVPGRGWTETPVAAGEERLVRSLPVKLRASIRDDVKTGLAARRAEGGRTVTFLDVEGALEGQAFHYRSEAGAGESRWTAAETYEWQMDNPRTKQLVRAWLARNSTRYARNDVLEMHPAHGTAQNIVLRVVATTVWTRRSVQNGRETTAEVTPKDGRAEARLVVSVMPK